MWTIQETILAQDVVEKLDKLGLFNTKTPEEVDCFKKDYLYQLADLGVQLYHGLTKCVIVSNMIEHLVIKFGLYSRDTKDYMDVEYDNYYLAIDAGWDKFLAATEWGGTTSNGHNFYFQEKCSTDGDNKSSALWEYCYNTIDKEDNESDEEYSDRISDAVSEIDSDDAIWAFMGNDYTCNEIDDFLWWCDENNINDLHVGNFGMNEEGHWVIIDYSGFM